MNKRALEVFAPTERNNLRKAVERRLTILGIFPNKTYEHIEEWMNVEDGVITINGTQYINTEPELFRRLFKEYKNVGYDSLIEETAYTWFNRLMAIRYMEIKGVLPDLVKIIGNNGIIPRPEILSNYQYLEDRINTVEIEELKVKKEEAAYRKLFLAASNKLGDNLPFLFKPLDDWMELLLPSKMLEPGGIIDRMVSNEGLTSSFEEGVEAIGWLYQFYIAQVKKEVMKMKVVPKEKLPPRTQLFTPKWIVKYMVENTLGQLYLERDEKSYLKDSFQYYVDETDQDDNIKNKLNSLKYVDSNIEDISFLDPACGSGHILAYAYDVYFAIYREQGYKKREIPSLILQKNIFGLEIDERAAQLAGFTLIMKAVESIGRPFWRNVSTPNIVCIQQSNSIDKSYLEMLFSKEEIKEVNILVEHYKNAKEYGSLILPKNIKLNETIKGCSEKINDNQLSMFDYRDASHVDVSGQFELLKNLIGQHKIINKKYDIVVTNPPYMSSNSMSDKLLKFSRNNYSNSKSDLFAMFMERCREFTKKGGFNAAVNQHVWMFLPTYEEIRKQSIYNSTLISMLHLGAHAFEEIGGEVVQSTAYVIREDKIDGYKTCFFRLVDGRNTLEKEKKMLMKEEVYYVNANKFSSIPGSRLAYWISDKMYETYRNNPILDEVADVRVGLQTSDNPRFVRLWTEVNYEKVGRHHSSSQEALENKKKWFGFNKGGAYRKWYGNLDYVLNWESDGREAKEFATQKYKSYTRILKNLDYMFKKGISYSAKTTGNTSYRLAEPGYLFDVAGSSMFYNKKYNFLPYEYLLALLNTPISSKIMEFINPTINKQVGDIKLIPVWIPDDMQVVNKVKKLAEQNIELSKEEWNQYENSWDFKSNPLILYKTSSGYLSDAFKEFDSDRTNIIEQAKCNQERLNEIFINAYGLKNELSSEISYREVTLRRADKGKEVKYFLSYFIGCWFGRFSLDTEGLVFAGGEFSKSNYQLFKPSEDSIITITDEKVLPDDKDVFVRLKEFLIKIYGQETLDINLEWIAEGIGKKENMSIENTIRNYFIKQFFKDHLILYTDSTGKNKRPIYWPIDSGNAKGMYSFIYLHRYTSNTIGLAMNNHFVPLLRQWRSLEEITEEEINSNTFSSTEKKRKMSQLNLYKKRIEELEKFQDKLNDLAREEIEINLDDGVKVNYQEIKSVLTPIKM